MNEQTLKEITEKVNKLNDEELDLFIQFLNNLLGETDDKGGIN